KSLKAYFSKNDRNKLDLESSLEKLNKRIFTVSNERENAIRLVIKGILSEDDVASELNKIDGFKTDVEIQKEKLTEELQTLRNSEQILQDVRNSTDLSKSTDVSWNDRRNLIRTHIE